MIYTHTDMESITVRRAAPTDAAAINDIVKRAFALYRAELPDGIPLAALSETVAQTGRDIRASSVYVATAGGGKIVGTIRFEALSPELAYISRFAADPEINNSGVGGELIGRALADCAAAGYGAVALHTNSKYYKLARYYYGREFYVHSTDMSKGYIRALFVKDLSGAPVDLAPALKK